MFTQFTIQKDSCIPASTQAMCDSSLVQISDPPLSLSDSILQDHQNFDHSSDKQNISDNESVPEQTDFQRANRLVKSVFGANALNTDQQSILNNSDQLAESFEIAEMTSDSAELEEEKVDDDLLAQIDSPNKICLDVHQSQQLNIESIKLAIKDEQQDTTHEELIPQNFTTVSFNDRATLGDLREIVRKTLNKKVPIIFASLLNQHKLALYHSNKNLHSSMAKIEQDAKTKMMLELIQVKEVIEAEKSVFSSECEENVPQQQANLADQKPSQAKEECKSEICNLIIKAEMTQSSPHNSDQKNSLWKKAMANIFNSFQNTEWQSKQLPINVKLAANCSQDVYQEVQYRNEETTFTASWRLSNDQIADWPAGVQLTPIISSPTVRTIFDSKICQLKGNSEGLLKVKFELPDNFSHQFLVVMLRMRTTQTQSKYFGPNLLLFAKIISEDQNLNSVKICEQDDFAQMHVLRQSQSSDNYTEDYLLSMASILLDEGYGSFERCLFLIKCVRGDMEQARSMLSTLMITEEQLLMDN